MPSPVSPGVVVTQALPPSVPVSTRSSDPTGTVGDAGETWRDGQPIREIHDRWIDKYTERVTALLDLKQKLERDT
ncbi:MAG: hypothetical protein ACR2KL_05190 [Nocardioidaceae bacterium]